MEPFEQPPFFEENSINRWSSQVLTEAESLFTSDGRLTSSQKGLSLSVPYEALLQNSTGDLLSVAPFNHSYQNFQLYFSFTLQTPSNGSSLFVLTLRQSGGKLILVRFLKGYTQDLNADAVTVSEMIGGRESLVFSAPYRVEKGVRHTLCITCQGNSLRIMDGGETVADATLSSVTEGGNVLVSAESQGALRIHELSVSEISYAASSSPSSLAARPGQLIRLPQSWDRVQLLSSHPDSFYAGEGILRAFSPAEGNICNADGQTLTRVSVQAHLPAGIDPTSYPAALRYPLILSSLSSPALTAELTTGQFAAMLAESLFLPETRCLPQLSLISCGEAASAALRFGFYSEASLALRPLDSAAARQMLENAWTYVCGSYAPFPLDLSNYLPGSGKVSCKAALQALDVFLTLTDQLTEHFAVNGGHLLSITADSALRLYEPNAPIAFRVRFSDPRTFCATVQLIDLQYGKDQILSFTRDSLCINEQGLWADGRFIPQANGLYRLCCTFYDAERNVLACESLQLGVTPRAKQAADPDFFWGVLPSVAISYADPWETYLFRNRWQTQELVLDQLSYLGVNMVRIGNGALWSNLQASPDSPLNFTYTDYLVKQTAQRGIWIDWILKGTTPWSADSTYLGSYSQQLYEATGESTIPWYRCPPDPEAFTSFMEAFCRHYAQADNLLLEMDNEPTFSNFYGPASLYLQSLRIMCETARRINPKLLTATGGMVAHHAIVPGSIEEKYASATDLEAYYEGFLRLREEGLLDTVAWHAHTTEAFYRTAQKPGLLADMGTFPVEDEALFKNECGNVFADDALNASENLKKIVLMKCRNYRGYVLYFYNKCSPASGNARYENAWGNVSYRGEPNRTVLGYATAIRLLDGMKGTLEQETEGAMVLSFENESRTVVAAYRKTPACSAVLHIDPSSTYTVVDHFGNPIAVEGHRVTLSDEPVYVLFAQKGMSRACQAKN